MKKAAWIIGIVAAVIVFLPLTLIVLIVALYDFNGARPWINETISTALDREFAIEGDIDVGWVRRIEDLDYRLPRPRISIDKIRLGNPDWAKRERMAEVRNISVVFDPLRLIHKAVALPLVDIDQAVVNLERRADETNNWTFGENDEGTTTWRVAPGALRIRQSRLELDDAKHLLRLQATADSYDEGLRWQAEGTLNEAPLKASGMAGSLLALQDTETPYPIAFTIDAGASHVEAEGTLTNPSQLAALDMTLELAGANMADLYQLTKIALPNTRPFSTDGRLVGTMNEWGGTWHYENFNGRVGESNLSGTVVYEAREEQVPLLRGELTSDLLDFADLGPLIGVEPAASEPIESQDVDGRVLPDKDFQTERLSSIDADIRFEAKRIVVKSELPIDNLHARIKLEAGRLALLPLDFGVAQGNLRSRVELDSRQQPMAAAFDIEVDGLQLAQLIPATGSEQASLGQINGSAVLKGQGDSVADMLAVADGELRLFIDRGYVSRFILEAAGLNLLNAVVTLLFNDNNALLNCAAAQLVVKEGVMTTEGFIVDTEQALIEVDGSIDLGEEQLDLTVEPSSKGVRVLSLRAPLYVKGSFASPDISVDKSTLALRGGGAAALGAVAPAAALLALISPGEQDLGEDNGCRALLAQTRQEVPEEAAEGDAGSR